MIAPELLTLQLPLNVDHTALTSGEALTIRPFTELTDASFHLARARLSKIMHSFFGSYRHLRRGSQARHDLACETDLELERLLSESPFAAASRQAPLPVYIWYESACHLCRSLIAHKRLLLFREFFALT